MCSDGSAVPETVDPGPRSYLSRDEPGAAVRGWAGGRGASQHLPKFGVMLTGACGGKTSRERFPQHPRWEKWSPLESRDEAPGLRSRSRSSRG